MGADSENLISSGRTFQTLKAVMTNAFSPFFHNTLCNGEKIWNCGSQITLCKRQKIIRRIIHKTYIALFFRVLKVRNGQQRKSKIRQVLTAILYRWVFIWVVIEFSESVLRVIGGRTFQRPGAAIVFSHGAGDRSRKVAIA